MFLQEQGLVSWQNAENAAVSFKARPATHTPAAHAERLSLGDRRVLIHPDLGKGA